MTHADDLQAVSVDEALIDVTSSVSNMKVLSVNGEHEDATSPDTAKELAESIRAQVKEVTGCTGKHTKFCQCHLK